jgi:hypothetical protein
MSSDDTTSHVDMPLRQLEQSLIDGFVRARGYDPARLTELPPEEMHALLKDASIHASAKLTEIESRSHYLDELHGTKPGLP